MLENRVKRNSDLQKQLMTIKKATAEDIDKLVFLFEQYRAFYNKPANTEASKAFLVNRIINRESEIYIGELEDKTLAGFVQLYPYFSSINLRRLWLLNDLFVHPKHRGKGISVQLIKRAQQLATETNAYALMLETGKDNDIGNKLYPKTGFKLYDDVNFYEWRNPTVS
ncbi:MAG: GNAT superfamily N-acetyltransferase [Vicingaceae bacterium]|jgi:GNAT superfamily N-acetyltransferase